MHVVLAGGGTSGHIEPALAVADALRRRDPSIAITALGTERGLETRLVPERGYELALIPAVPLPRRPAAELLSVPFRLRAATAAAATIMRRVGADVVVGFGGYVALPAYLAARRLRLPVVVHEANARPGLANRVGARFARRVAAASPAVRLPRVEYVGMPLRRAIAVLDRAAARAGAREHFGLGAGPAVLVMGGSQGAVRIDAAGAGALPALRAAGVEVLHAFGPRNAPPAPGPGYVPLAYVDRMDLAYAAVDLAVCRAGAMTCAELAAVGLPAVYVPLPIGNGEQALNAAPFVAAGAARVVDDEALTPERLVTEVGRLTGEPDRLAGMSQLAARFGIRDADERMADIVLEAAR